MTQEEKNLLMIDLCARLPFHPKIQIYNDSWDGCKKGEFDNTMGFHHVEAFLCDRIEILPYLRPMSSMTDEEKSNFSWIAHEEYDGYDNNDCPIYTGGWTVDCDRIDEITDFLNSHHFDYRGLIQKGLALEAPEGLYINDKI